MNDRKCHVSHQRTCSPTVHLYQYSLFMNKCRSRVCRLVSSCYQVPREPPPKDLFPCVARKTRDMRFTPLRRVKRRITTYVLLAFVVPWIYSVVTNGPLLLAMTLARDLGPLICWCAPAVHMVLRIGGNKFKPCRRSMPAWMRMGESNNL